MPVDNRVPSCRPAGNVWTLSLSPDAGAMTYYLERDGKPRFKAELHRKPAPG